MTRLKKYISNFSNRFGCVPPSPDGARGRIATAAPHRSIESWPTESTSLSSSWIGKQWQRPIYERPFCLLGSSVFQVGCVLTASHCDIVDHVDADPICQFKLIFEQKAGKMIRICRQFDFLGQRSEQWPDQRKIIMHNVRIKTVLVLYSKVGWISHIWQGKWEMFYGT